MDCRVVEVSGIWSVPLGSSHKHFGQIEFKRGRTSPNYEVVIVDTRKFIELYENNFDTLPPISSAKDWPSDKLEGVAEFLKPGNCYPEMPRVSFFLDKVRSFKTFWLAREMPILTFGNGRHRVRYLQYADAPCFPVEVGAQGADLLRRECGHQS